VRTSPTQSTLLAIAAQTDHCPRSSGAVPNVQDVEIDHRELQQDPEHDRTPQPRATRSVVTVNRC
jgi:hypothetical protein